MGVRDVSGILIISEDLFRFFPQARGSACCFGGSHH